MMCYYLNVQFQGQRVKQSRASEELQFKILSRSAVPESPQNTILGVPTELAPLRGHNDVLLWSSIPGKCGMSWLIVLLCRRSVVFGPGPKVCINKTRNSPSREWSVEGLHVTQPLLSIRNASHSLSLNFYLYPTWKTLPNVWRSVLAQSTESPARYTQIQAKLAT